MDKQREKEKEREIDIERRRRKLRGWKRKRPFVASADLSLSRRRCCQTKKSLLFHSDKYLSKLESGSELTKAVVAVVVVVVVVVK